MSGASTPSYLPPQLASYFTRFGAPWTTLRETNLRLLLETAPKGFSPNWVKYQKKGGWQLSQDASPIGSYDAIRVYLWVGMMNDNDPQKARLLARFKPMATTTIKQGLPPEKVDVATGKRTGDGPVGFSPPPSVFTKPGRASGARQHVADRFPDNNALLQLRSDPLWTRWDQHRFRFTVQVNYYRTGARNAHVHTESTTLSLGLALMPWPRPPTPPQQRQLLEQVRLGNPPSVRI